ncbi:MAG TPA: 7TM diverse intracellular signaling domain-containing protein [Cytophagales bacterium]|nr:7TM diverse intracellular signaling domain-containing protein [Cytophagales bacterium]
MKRLKYITFVFFIFFSINFKSFTSNLLTLRTQSEYFLNDYLEIFEDTIGTLTIKEISAPSFKDNFKRNSVDYPYAKNGSSAYWIRVYINNQSSVDQKWVFEVLSLHTQSLQIYFPGEKGGVEVYKTGQNYDFKKRKYKVKNFIFDVPLIRNKTYPIYLRVESDNEASFEYKIRTQEFFTEYATAEYASLGFYYGILGFLIVYTLLLFFTSKEKAYLFYIFYIFSCVLISLEGDGLGFQYLWSQSPVLNPYISTQWIWFLFLLSFIFYAKYFINIRSNYPKFNQAIIVLILVDLILEVTQIVPSILINYFFLVPLSLVYGIAIHGYYKGATSNRFFIIGQTFLLASIFVTRSTWYGILPSNIFTVYSFNYGVLLESIIFSYAFIDKYNLIKKEKDAAQHDIINQLEENKALQTKVNRELEKKVQERTRLLQQEKEKLNEANSKLEILMTEVNKMNSKLDYENWHLNKKVGEETKARIVAKEVSIEEFQKIFPSEHACLKYLEELKWANGYKCRKCGNSKFIQLNKLLSRRCSRCTYIESVTNSTLFHSLRFPINKAFYIVYHCSFSGGKMTIDELSSRLELRRNTCWSFKKRVLERIELNKKANKNINKWEVLIID